LEEIMIKENYIFFDIDAKNKEEALDFVSSKAFEYGITDDKDGLLGDFLKREEEYSTGLQDEFAIPHAKSTHAKEVAIFFVKCKNELDWETLDDSKVKYLFALIVPMENAGKYITYKNQSLHLWKTRWKKWKTPWETAPLFHKFSGKHRGKSG